MINLNLYLVPKLDLLHQGELHTIADRIMSIDHLLCNNYEIVVKFQE
jgi:hypothetical protein